VTAGPRFFFDLASPEAYLTAERILGLVPGPCEWVPVLIGPAAVDRAAIEATARARGLQPVRWPSTVPFDSTFAMRAATYAKRGGKTVAFALAAFRQAYAGGRDLGRADDVLIAGAACELHPRALLAGAGAGGVARELEGATQHALRLGVRSTPAVWTGEAVTHGDGALADAVERLSGRA
jgi:2-hydroxychromene-2-carboxylate isomerase